MRRALALVLVAAAAVAAIAFWPSPEAEGLIPEDAVVTLEPGSAELAFSLRNVRDEAVRIAGIGTASGPVRLLKGSLHSGHSAHDHSAGGDAWRESRGKAALDVPAGGRRSFPPPGARLVLADAAGLADGEVVPVTIDLGEAGTLTLAVRVEAPAHSGAMDGMDHGSETARHVPGPGEPLPSISIAASPDRDGGWTLAIHAVDFVFAPDAVDGPHVPGEGHGHLYVNDLKIGRVLGEVHRLPPLLPGRNAIRVELNTNDHRLYAPNGVPLVEAIEVEQVE